MKSTHHMEVLFLVMLGFLLHTSESRLMHLQCLVPGTNEIALSCDSNQHLQILSIHFGQTSSQYCPNQPGTQVSSCWHDSPEVNVGDMLDECEQPSCTYNVKYPEEEGRCDRYGTHDHRATAINYECDSSGSMVLVKCLMPDEEEVLINQTCNQHLEIHDVYFGEVDQRFCAHGWDSQILSCWYSSSDVTAGTFMEECHNEASCTFHMAYPLPHEDSQQCTQDNLMTQPVIAVKYQCEIAGITVGVAVGGTVIASAVIFAVIGLLYRRRRDAVKKGKSDETDVEVSKKPPSPVVNGHAISTVATILSLVEENVRKNDNLRRGSTTSYKSNTL